jgi:hypothetical protein
LLAADFFETSSSSPLGLGPPFSSISFAFPFSLVFLFRFLFSIFFIPQTMDAMDESPDEASAVPVNLGGCDAAVYKPRGYQLEMLQVSQWQNIIVAVCLSTKGTSTLPR